ncbi:MAG: acylphosphatase [Chloroflexota bacterium]
MKRLSAKVYGRVQGVFFRDTTRREAQRRNVSGWVRNEPDGSVRVVAEGSQGALTELERFLHQGPSSARVERVETTWDDATGEFSGFRVRY